MKGSHQSTVTRLLSEYRAGSQAAFDEVVRIVYDELRGLAHAQRQRWPSVSARKPSGSCRRASG
jgi:hypothetical protein